MSEVYKLGISVNNNQPINEVNSIDVIKNQGVVGDRHFKEFNDPYNQLSLIESENIDYYNIKYGVNIPYLDFRRNVVTKGIQLNDLVGKKILVGNLEVEGEVIGNISAEGTQSKVRVLQSGTVSGDIAVATIIVNGHVKGDIHASELVELAAKAVVEGDLNYNLIGIEKGAEVVGRFVYHSAESNITEFPADRDEAV